LFSGVLAWRGGGTPWQGRGRHRRRERYDIACGQIDIGNAATALTERMSEGVPQPDGSSRAEPVMDVSAVPAALLYMASLPLEANVPSLW
jgi:hypothetical protein